MVLWFIVTDAAHLFKHPHLYIYSYLPGPFQVYFSDMKLKRHFLNQQFSSVDVVHTHTHTNRSTKALVLAIHICTCFS